MKISSYFYVYLKRKVMNTVMPDKISTLFPPTVVTTINGRFAVFAGGPNGGWYPVSDTFSVEDAQKRWIKMQVTPNKPKTSSTSFKVENSKKNGYYEVKFDKQVWSCTCTGFGFRRSCKHIEQMKKKVK